MSDTFHISLFNNKKDNQPKEEFVSWERFCARIKKPYVRSEKDGAAFAPCYFVPTLRRKENVRELSMLVFDVDVDIPIKVLRDKIQWLNSTFAIYSTHSHKRQTNKNPNKDTRWRVCIPLDKPVSANEFTELWNTVNQMFDLKADEQARDIARIHYVPCKESESAEYEFYIESSENLFNWRDFLTQNKKAESEAGEVVAQTTVVNFDRFTSHDERHAELCRRIELQAKRNGRGAFDMRCPAHNGKGETSLVYFPDSKSVKCNKGCDYFSILHAFGLPNGHLPNSLNEYSSITNENDELRGISENAIPVLSESALYGLAGDIVRKIEPHTEADNVALLIQFLAGFGCLIGKTAYFRAESDVHYLKIFAVIVGVSSKGRKGTSLGQIRGLLVRVDETFLNVMQDGLSSGEGLIFHVRDRQEKEVAIKSKGIITGYQTEIIDAGATEKRVFVVEPEFARVLRVMKREGNTLSSVIRQAWDSDRLRVMTKTPLSASQTHISIIGHITKDELLRNLDESETANGFANRYFWIYTKRSKLLPEGGSLSESDLNDLVTRLHEAKDFAQACGELKRNDEAREFWYEIYPKLSQGRTGLLGAVTSRAEAQVMRLACLYALLDCSNEIRLEHLKAALALWQYAEDSARYIFGNSIGNRIADEIFTALQNAPEGLDKTQIRDLFNRNRSANEINRALQTLLEYGCIQRREEKTQGRKREIFEVLTLRH